MVAGAQDVDQAAELEPHFDFAVNEECFDFDECHRLTPFVAAGKAVTTIEGLGTPQAPHPLQAAFIAEQAAQCGWCTAGMVVEGAALLARNAQPGRDEAKVALEGHLCRCGSHHRVLRAVLRAGGREPS